ncbi:MAG: pantoate--beta-alanine ligase [Victivallales bacterium]|nr:pantoate--beta-alanine ligase [Victivallales bacterium]
MKICRTVEEMRAVVNEWRACGLKIGLVPTMGYLHAGHISLVKIARKNADRVVLSLFVNPTQFGPTEDLDKYPRDFERDRQACEENGVDAIFAPTPAVMYDEDFSTWVKEESLSQVMCGVTRPIHFRGVCTVCLKLFNITRADVAVFGRKDAQQALIIERMVRDLNVPIKIITAPLVREEDGLALSSRNRYLSEDEHRRALSLSQGLFAAEKAFANGERNAAALIALVENSVSANGGKIDYVVVNARNTLRPLETIDRPALLAAAVYFGTTRLIDNVFLG